MAAALWRNLIRDKNAVDVVAVSTMVHYVRKQIYHLEQIDSEKLLKYGVLSWGGPAMEQPVQKHVKYKVTK